MKMTYSWEYGDLKESFTIDTGDGVGIQVQPLLKLINTIQGRTDESIDVGEPTPFPEPGSALTNVKMADPSANDNEGNVEADDDLSEYVAFDHLLTGCEFYLSESRDARETYDARRIKPGTPSYYIRFVASREYEPGQRILRRDLRIISPEPSITPTPEELSEVVAGEPIACGNVFRIELRTGGRVAVLKDAILLKGDNLFQVNGYIATRDYSPGQYILKRDLGEP